MFTFYVLFGLLSTGVWSSTDYSGHRLVKARTTTTEKQSALANFLISENSKGNIDIWNLPQQINKEVTFSASDNNLQICVDWMRDNGITFDIIQEDLQSLAENEAIREAIAHATAMSGAESDGINLNVYHDHDEMNQFLLAMEGQCDICTTVNIGQSYEGRDMIAIKIGGQRSFGKKVIWIDAGIHAREWISPATALNIINQFVRGYNSDDTDILWLLDNFIWYIIPSINPDGYTYSRDHDRFWRKTRSPNDNSECAGTDPNRNWSFHWAEVGVDLDPCTEIYPGPQAFSEVEARNVRDFVYARRNSIIAYLSLHSFGQYWLYPWGYNSSLPNDWEELDRVGRRAVNKIQEVSGKEYTLGSSTNVLYAASGASDDWAKGVANIKYSYTVELRDDGVFGFLLPSSQIEPTFIEIWAAILEMSHAIREYLDGEFV